MGNPENTGFAPSGEDLRAKLSEKIKELEQMQENLDEHNVDEINGKLKEIKQMQKALEEYHESIKRDNLKKQTTEKELNSKIKEMKRLQTAIEKENGITSEKRKRRHKNYKLAINHTALKELEGITTGSFIALVRAVILIDGKPYEDTEITLSKERKRDFGRLIDHYALVEVIGKRKYHVKRVYDKKQRVESNESEKAADTPKNRNT